MTVHIIAGVRGQRIAIMSLVAIVVSLGLIHYLALPTSNRFQRALVDFGHVPVFAIVGLVVLKLKLYLSRGRAENPAVADYVVATLAIVALASLSEVLQVASPGRTASASDALRDCVGGAIGLSLFAAASARRHHPEPLRRRVIFLLVAGILISVTSAPVVRIAAASIERGSHWPTIIGGNYWAERQFSIPYIADLQTRPIPERWRIGESEHAFRIQHFIAGYSGFLVQELARDHAHFKRACIEITNAEARTLEINIWFGNQPMFFRSTAFSSQAFDFPGQTRASECLDLPSTVNRSVGTGNALDEYSGTFRSMAIMARGANSVHYYYLHRLWLE